MKLEKNEVPDYIEANKRFHSKCYEIFLLTVQKEEDGSAKFDSFDIHTDISSIHFKDFEGDLCEFAFPTDWLQKESDEIGKEYARLKKEHGEHYFYE